METDLNATVITDATELAKAEQALKGEINDFKLYDINLAIKSDEIQPTGKVTVKIPIEKYKEGVKVVHFMKDGSAVEVVGSVKSGYFVFQVNHFSKFAIGNLTSTTDETSGTAGTVTPVTKDTNPKTGDSSNELLALVLLMGAAGVVLKTREKKVD